MYDFIARLKNADVITEITMMLNFMESFTNYSEDSRVFYRQSLPEEILLIQQSLMIGVWLMLAVILANLMAICKNVILISGAAWI